MSINTVTILGTDSISGSRITINNNFTEIKEKVDPILDSYDTNNGVFNISELPNGQLIAKRLTITTAGIQVQGGDARFGSTTNVTLNGGNLELTTGSANFGGGATINELILSNNSAIYEEGDLRFETSASTINDTSFKRTMILQQDNTATSFTFSTLSRSAEIFIINEKTDPVTLEFEAGLFTDDDASIINVPSNGTALLKFVIPESGENGRWWFFGGTGSSITTS